MAHERAVVFPFISETGNNDAVYNVKFTRNDEKKDERVDKIISLLNANFDWSTFVWQVEEDIRTEDQLDVKVNVAVEGTQDQLDGKDKVAVENEVPVTEKEERVEPVAKRRVTKKTKDPGCESRKRLLLCQRASEKNTGLSDETKTFITGLFNTSFNSMKQEVQKHVDHRFDKLDSEIAQLKQTVTALANTRNLAPASETPQPSPMPSPRPQRKDEKLDDVEMHDFHGNLHNVTVSQSSNIDLEMGTQDYLWKTMGNLTQDSYVKGFDPSQKAKVDDPMEWITPLTSFNPKKTALPFLRDIELPEDRVKDKDYSLVFVSEESWSKLVEWSLTNKELQIGPSLFTKEMSARIVGPTEWLKNFVSGYKFQLHMLFVLVVCRRKQSSEQDPQTEMNINVNNTLKSRAFEIDLYENILNRTQLP
ncbi:hypothetical protein Bca52824_022283 [Brassica carinata]|uniref:Uncharacterized protein n=1 Tax=Brassica carinata TaxID=52824 RepID=A0A8X7VGA4_BRACI|nr:hypothetical protein Bca52824_022283 [Brassica carinata]